MDFRGVEVEWLGHASLKFTDNGFTLAVDPFSEFSTDFEADIILVTHKDEGHFDREAIEEISGPRTCVVVPESMKGEDIPCKDVETVEEGEVLDIYSVEIEPIPMYNEHHDRGEGVGYRFVMAGTSFYVAGDTGIIDETDMLENAVDIAFLPVEGVFTMDIEEAVNMAVRIKPSTAVPYHFGEPFFEDVNLRGMKASLEDRNIGFEKLDKKG